MNKSALTYITCLCIFSISLKAQYTVFSKGSKSGIKSGNEILVKAKYTTALIGDTAIFALERKGTWEYMTAGGNTIYAAKHSRFLPFRNGFGLVNDTKFETCWYTIDKTGKEMARFFELGEPEVYGDKILFPVAKKLYDKSGIFICKYDTLATLNENLFFIGTAESISKPGKKQGTLFSKVFDKTVNRIVVKKTGFVVKDIETVQQLSSGCFCLAKDEKNLLILDAKGEVLIEEITRCEQSNDENICIISKATGKGIFDLKNKKWLVEPKGMKSVDTVGTYLWAGSADGSYSIITEGAKIVAKAEGIFRKKITEERIVAESTTGLFVCNLDGKKIGDSYDAIISEVQDGKMIVQKNKKFAYIDFASGKVIGEYRDLYYSEGKSAVSNGMRKFMTFFAAVVAIPALPMVEKALEKNKNKIYIYTANAPAAYKEGYVVLAVADKESIKPRGDSLFLDGGEFSLDYVYLNEEGKIVSPTFDEALSFNNGWAWVKGSKGFYRVNKSFQALDKNYYESVEEVWDGAYYKVENGPFHTGLIDRNGNIVAPTKYDWIEIEKDQIIGKKGGDGTVLVTK